MPSTKRLGGKGAPHTRWAPRKGRSAGEARPGQPGRASRRAPVPRCTRDSGRARGRCSPPAAAAAPSPRTAPVRASLSARGRGATTSWAWRRSEPLYAAGTGRPPELRAVAAAESNDPGGGRGGRGEGEEPRRRRKKRKESAGRGAPIVPHLRRPGHVAPLSPAPRPPSLGPHAVARHHGQGGERRGRAGAGSGKFTEPDVADAPFPWTRLRFVCEPGRPRRVGPVRGRPWPLARGAGAEPPCNVRGGRCRPREGRAGPRAWRSPGRGAGFPKPPAPP